MNGIVRLESILKPHSGSSSPVLPWYCFGLTLINFGPVPLFKGLMQLRVYPSPPKNPRCDGEPTPSALIRGSWSAPRHNDILMPFIEGIENNVVNWRLSMVLIRAIDE